MNKNLVMGILAHVDAGKTTLAESILYTTGTIRKLGRVDHQNAFLDTFEMERARGITIFSKQARLTLKDLDITILDTPGHVDFSAEMERTLQVLDVAILVISGPDGIQGHDMTLWRLLKQYRIPTFIFVNKMDMPGTDKMQIQKELQKHLEGSCVLFEESRYGTEDFYDELAMCGEDAMQEFLEEEKVSDDTIRSMIAEREVFPCFYGSALKVDGIKEFLEDFARFQTEKIYPDTFSARVYKISRDNQGARLTHMKITGGSLKVKQVLEVTEDGESQKADQIRLYSGAAYKTTDEVHAGEICAITGLDKSFSGKGYGDCREGSIPLLEPVLTYRIILPEECNVHDTYLKLCQLEEEEPQLHIVWDEKAGEIHVRVMGEVQIEVLKNMIAQRYGIAVSFGNGSITYKETIAAPVEGVGHFEPLRHYAEVHLLMEPLERGSGLIFETDVSEDELDKNWQRLILTHLEERKHLGVLTGSDITDMKITLIAGRSHLKHTEGGDFRQATYRAVRQGLKKAESILLEPVYGFRLELPQENVGRAMGDITRMHGQFSGPEMEGDMAVLTGTAPVSLMRDYQREVVAYTKGRGRFFCNLSGYEECHNTEEVLSEIFYDSELDFDNPTGSVFCSHGAGFVVPWYEVESYMHLQTKWSTPVVQEEEYVPVKQTSAVYAASRGWGDDKELEEIFTRTYGGGGDTRSYWGRSRYGSAPTSARTIGEHYRKPKAGLPEYLLVDGYNIIFAIPVLKELAEINIDSARDKLMDLLCNYQGYKKCTLILVYDAYKVEGGVGSVMKYHNIHVVYTREAETADQYIEKTVHEISHKYHVTVATSDALEQKIIWGAGADRMSAAGLWEELELVQKEIREQYLQNPEQSSGQKLFHNLNEEMQAALEEVRLGRLKFEDIDFS